MKYVRTIFYFMVICTSVSLRAMVVDVARILPEEMSADYSHAELLTAENSGESVLRIDERDPRRIQVRCISQRDAGGLNSCGYHTVNNCISLALAQYYPDQRSLYLSRMHSADHINDTFGSPTAPWRLFIMRRRMQEMMAAYLKDKLLRALKFKKFEKEAPTPPSNAVLVYSLSTKRQRYLCITELPKDCFPSDVDSFVNQINDVAAILAKRGVIVDEGFHYRFSKADFSQVFERRIQRAYIHHQTEDGQFRTLFDYFFNDTLDIDVVAKFDQTVCTPDNTILYRDRHKDPDGASLLTDEIMTLIDREKEEGALEGLPIITATYDIPNDRENIQFHPFFDGFRELYVRMRETDQDVIGCVAVYLSYARHYISLIVSRINSETRFIITDSYLNTDRLRNSLINQIIGILDGTIPVYTHDHAIGISPATAGARKTPLNSPRTTNPRKSASASSRERRLLDPDEAQDAEHSRSSLKNRQPSQRAKNRTSPKHAQAELHAPSPSTFSLKQIVVYTVLAGLGASALSIGYYLRKKRKELLEQKNLMVKINSNEAFESQNEPIQGTF